MTIFLATGLLIPWVVDGEAATGDGRPIHTNPSPTIEPIAQDDAVLRAHQQQRLAQISGLQVQFDERQIPRILKGKLGHVHASNAEADLSKLMRDLAPVFKAAGTESFHLMHTQDYKRSGRKVYSLQQRIDDTPVLGGELHIQVDSATNEVERISGVYIPDRGIQKTYSLSSVEAVRAAIEYIGRQNGLNVVESELFEEPELVFAAIGPTARPVWRFAIQLLFSNGTGSSESLTVDANDGSITTRIFPLPHQSRLL